MPKACSSSVDRRLRESVAWLALVALLIGAHAEVSAQSEPRELQLIAPLPADVPVSYFIAGSETPAGGSDVELCLWALNDWVRHSAGQLAIEPAAEAEARIRVYFVEPGAGRYGEMRPILVDGERGAEVYVRASTDSLGPEIAVAARDDALLRDTIVYLTCLHELGHALGMVHTDAFADVMYFFGFGGDISAFFGRYRARLDSRADIAQVSGLSAGDIAQLEAAYPPN